MFGRKSTLGRVLAALALAPWWARANAPIQEGAPLIDFVEQGKPEWNFARAADHDSCWPAYAFLPPDGRPNPGVKVRYWPKTNEENCPKKDGDFPTYFVAQKCSDDEIRVSYTLYIPNSGFKPSGHKHDFEGIVLIWRRDGDQWTRDHLLLSQHSGYADIAWPEAESWLADWTSAGLGNAHPRIFMGWGSHAMYNNQETEHIDVLSQYNPDLEYRSQEYAHHDYVLREVTQDNDVGKRFEAALNAAPEELGGPGKKGNPLIMARTLCTLEGQPPREPISGS